ncbi:hypothetical protein ACSQ67_022856 [Phaseolus vulgaris]
MDPPGSLNGAKAAALHHYNKSFQGYSAMITPEQASQLAASIIVGSTTANASLFGIGKGTSRGGAPSARLSIYMACWFGLCNDDVLSAMEDAIHDSIHSEFGCPFSPANGCPS